MHHEEYHITVGGVNVPCFRRLCESIGVKPLWIELNTFERQLMCAAGPRLGGPEAVTREFRQRGYEILRVKHEVQPHKIDITTHGDAEKKWLDVPKPESVLYYECHAKFDGPFRPAMYMSSRDLLRSDRWYLTRRQPTPFDPQAWIDMVTTWAAMQDGWREPSRLAGWEYEAAILDTNPELDARWSSFTR